LIGPLIPQGNPAVVRGRRLTDAASAAVGRVSAADDTFASLGEVLMWLIALEDLVVSVDGQYWTKRNADVDGAVLPGIRYARNAVVHGQSVTTTVHTHGGAMLGAAMLGTFALGEGPSTRWSNRSSIGFTPSKDVPQQEQSYDSQIAGQPVLPPLERALAFLRFAAGT
jgi:hypothetical protein